MPTPVTFEFETLPYAASKVTDEFFCEIPKRSGVFRIFDVYGNLIILEKTHNLARRIERFFFPDTVDIRALDLRDITGRIEYCRTDSPMETLYLLYCERRRWFPETYRKMRTFPLFHMMKINRRQRFPRIYATRQVKRGVEYFGPFASRAQLERLKTTLERTFKIRPCQYNIRGNDPYPDCLYFQMSTCSKPCNDDIDREAYLGDIDHAIAFIEGKDAEIEAPLIARMEELAQETKFEDAERLRRQLDRLRRARRDHHDTYFNLWNFDFVAVMDADSVKRRKIAFIHAGSIQGVEEYAVDEIVEDLSETLRKQFGAPAPATDRDRQYDEFCLVSCFITQPVQSVRLTPVGDPRTTSAHIIDNLQSKKRKKANKSNVDTVA